MASFDLSYLIILDHGHGHFRPARLTKKYALKSQSRAEFAFISIYESLVFIIFTPANVGFPYVFQTLQ